MLLAFEIGYLIIFFDAWLGHLLHVYVGALYE
jgi:hypothetical protein